MWSWSSVTLPKKMTRRARPVNDMTWKMLGQSSNIGIFHDFSGVHHCWIHGSSHLQMQLSVSSEGYPQFSSIFVFGFSLLNQPAFLGYPHGLGNPQWSDGWETHYKWAFSREKTGDEWMINGLFFHCNDGLRVYLGCSFALLDDWSAQKRQHVFRRFKAQLMFGMRKLQTITYNIKPGLINPYKPQTAVLVHGGYHLSIISSLFS